MREKYLKMRNSKKIDNNFFWEYYKNKGGVITNPNKFFEIMYYENKEIQNGFFTSHEVVQRDLTPILSHLDKEFNFTVLYGEDGNFIKVIE